MRIINYRLGEKAGLYRATVALGYFDGVHVGHRRLISEGISEEELLVFNSVLERIEARAREIGTEGERA